MFYYYNSIFRKLLFGAIQYLLKFNFLKSFFKIVCIYNKIIGNNYKNYMIANKFIFYIIIYQYYVLRIINIFCTLKLFPYFGMISAYVLPISSLYFNLALLGKNICQIDSYLSACTASQLLVLLFAIRGFYLVLLFLLSIGTVGIGCAAILYFLQI